MGSRVKILAGEQGDPGGILVSHDGSIAGGDRADGTDLVSEGGAVSLNADFIAIDQRIEMDKRTRSAVSQVNMGGEHGVALERGESGALEVTGLAGEPGNIPGGAVFGNAHHGQGTVESGDFEGESGLGMVSLVSGLAGQGSVFAGGETGVGQAVADVGGQASGTAAEPGGGGAGADGDEGFGGEGGAVGGDGGNAEVVGADRRGGEGDGDGGVKGDQPADEGVAHLVEDGDLQALDASANGGGDEDGTGIGLVSADIAAHLGKEAALVAHGAGSGVAHVDGRRAVGDGDGIGGAALLTQFSVSVEEARMELAMVVMAEVEADPLGVATLATAVELDLKVDELI